MMAQIDYTVCSNRDRGKHKESNWRATSSDVIPSRLFINSPHNVTCGRRLRRTGMKPPRTQTHKDTHNSERLRCLLTPQTLHQSISGAEILHVTLLGERALFCNHIKRGFAGSVVKRIHTGSWRITGSWLGWNRQ